jgi:hypothetical protein
VTDKTAEPHLIGDMTDEEIQEWKNSRNGIPGLYFAAATAEGIRQGKPGPGQEIYGAEIRKWLFTSADGMPVAHFESAMNMLVEKKMVQVVEVKKGRKVEKFYYVAGRDPMPRAAG